jgi:hypothetical protein
LKTIHDAVRPFSAIRMLYKNQRVRAWGGPGKGTVNDMPGEEWLSYLNVADHPEYPSGSAAFCGAHTQAARRFLGDDNLGWNITYAPGSSVIEPGVTPAAPFVLSLPTWTDFEDRCGISRMYAGVHFRSAVRPAQLLGREVGDIAYEFVKAHIDGTIGDDDDDDDHHGGCH